MRPQLEEVPRARLPVRHRREQRRPPLALRARLDAREAVEELLPPLGQAAVDLGVRPARLVADLLVGATLRLEQERGDLLGLQPLQRLRRAPDAVEALGALVHRLEVAGLALVVI